MTPPPSVPTNPFLAHECLPQAVMPTPLRDASIPSRLRGLLADGVALSALLLGPLSVLAMTTPATSPGITNGVVALSIIGGAVVYVATQAYLVTTQGQSIGKMYARTRIVRVDGSKVDFFRGVFLRSWVWTGISQVPLVGAFATFANIVAVFGDDRRALHDRIADTRVVDFLP